MVSLEIPWYKTRVVNCAFCGQMLPRRAWRDERVPERHFCSESCASRFVKQVPDAPDPT
jgi:hypothetical protein